MGRQMNSAVNYRWVASAPLRIHTPSHTLCSPQFNNNLMLRWRGTYSCGCHDIRTGVKGPGGEALAPNPQVLALSLGLWFSPTKPPGGVGGAESAPADCRVTTMGTLSCGRPQVNELWGLRMGAVLRLLILLGCRTGCRVHVSWIASSVRLVSHVVEWRLN